MSASDENAIHHEEFGGTRFSFESNSIVDPGDLLNSPARSVRSVKSRRRMSRIMSSPDFQRVMMENEEPSSCSSRSDRAGATSAPAQPRNALADIATNTSPPPVSRKRSLSGTDDDIYPEGSLGDTIVKARRGNENGARIVSSMNNSRLPAPRAVPAHCRPSPPYGKVSRPIPGVKAPVRTAGAGPQQNTFKRPAVPAASAPRNFAAAPRTFSASIPQRNQFAPTSAAARMKPPVAPRVLPSSGASRAAGGTGDVKRFGYQRKMTPFEAAKAENAQLTSDNQALQEQVANMESQLDGVEQELSDVRRKGEENALNLRRQLQDKTEEHNKVSRQYRELKDLCRKQHSQLETQAQSLTKFKEEMAQLEKLKQQYAAAKERNASLTLQNTTLTENLTNTKCQLEKNMQEMISLQAQITMLAASVANYEKTVEQKNSEISQMKAVITEGETLRRRLHNTILELKGNIRVFCRVRPVIPRDADRVAACVGFPKQGLDGTLELRTPGPKTAMGEESQKVNAFTFDKVFMPQADNALIFDEVSQLVQSALDGYSVCIFAYGATGSGKTYTMEGPPRTSGNGHNIRGNDRGIIPRAVTQVFEKAQELRAHGWEHTITAQFIEIYNEDLHDLLASNHGAYISGSGSSTASSSSSNALALKQQQDFRSRSILSTNSAMTAARPEATTTDPNKIEIRHLPDGSTVVTNVQVVEVTDENAVHRLLTIASQNRASGATLCNERSSRSHSVFTLTIKGINRGTEQNIRGVLNLIDLAGSERLAISKAVGDRQKETQHINASLSSLGDVIFALASKKPHVPFRNSKLTYLLKNCLGGDAKCLMLVNVSPHDDCAPESLNSLRFAQKVNSCEIGTARRLVAPINTPASPTKFTA